MHTESQTLCSSVPVRYACMYAHTHTHTPTHPHPHPHPHPHRNTHRNTQILAHCMKYNYQHHIYQINHLADSVCQHHIYEVNTITAAKLMVIVTNNSNMMFHTTGLYHTPEGSAAHRESQLFSGTSFHLRRSPIV